MIKNILILTLSIVLFQWSFAQSEKAYSASANDALWIQMMYAEDADFGAVSDEYHNYFKTNEFVKTRHTQFFKRWIKNASRTAIPLNEIDNAYWEENNQNYLSRTAELQAARGGNGSWLSVGPFDFDLDAVDRSYAAGAVHVYTVEQSLSNPDILYCGTANAGVWKSTDGANNWFPVTKDMLVKEVYSVEIHPTNPDIVYFGGDDGDLYLSNDGGGSWNTIGDASFNANNHELRDIVLQPGNPDVLFLASTVGFYKSIDGGTTFSQSLAGEFQEIEIHPTMSNVVYTIRQSSSKTTFYKSTDNGDFFTIYSNGWPTPVGLQEQERTEIAVSPDEPNKVVALCTGEANGGTGLYGIYVSNDAGENWTFECCGPQPGGAPDSTNLNLMGWDDAGLDDGGQYYYDLALAVSPTDADSIFVGGVNLWISGDGGSTFTCPSKWSHSYKDNYVHADIHDIRFFGSDLWIANDGGIFHSTDAGANFDPMVYGLEGTDFWGFGAGFWEGDVMVGGCYHNGTLLKDNDVFTNGWISTDGGDGTRGFVNPGESDVVYTDYNRKKLSGDRTVEAATFPYNQKPNIRGPGRESEMVFDLDCYTCFYSGFENSLWHTEDNGLTYELIYEFTHDVGEIEIPRSNTDYIYVTTYDGFYGTKRIWKSIDKGESFEDITIPTADMNGNTDRPYVLAVNHSNADEMVVGRVGYFETLDGFKTYQTTDGGVTWTNISSASLDGEMLVAVVGQAGTDGGVWLSTRRTVYYKNNNNTEWQLYNVDLPASTYSTRLVPYYRKGMIRNASDRSVYEAPFIDDSQIQAQISVRTKTLACTEDTAYFVDHSIMSETGANWTWQFPGGTPSTSNERAPKVVYSQPGDYSVTLVVTDQSGTSTQSYTDFITVNDGCSPDGIPGNAVKQTNSGDFVSVPPLDLNTNTFTVSAWIKPDGVQNTYSGVFIGGENGTGGLNFRDSLELAYHWPGGEWWWSSGLFVPDGEWSHVAMVVTPTDVTLYLNGIGSTHTITADPVDFSGSSYIGSYRAWGGRNYIGEIDEVAIWNKSLTQNDIREQMHLTKSKSADSDLFAYYQFNNVDGIITDRANGKHANFSGNAERIVSSAPVGAGTSDRFTINGSNFVSVPNTGTEMNWNGNPLPDGELCISRLDITPFIAPPSEPNSGAYWILHHFGSNAYEAPTDIKFTGYKNLSPDNAATPDSLYMYTRGFNSEINDWINDATAVEATGGAIGSVKFGSASSLNGAKQIIILNDHVNVAYNPTAISEASELQSIKVYPNPVESASAIQIASELDEEITFKLYDNNGRTLHTASVITNGEVLLPELPVGMYYYRLLVGKYMRPGKLIID